MHAASMAFGDRRDDREPQSSTVTSAGGYEALEDAIAVHVADPTSGVSDP